MSKLKFVELEGEVQFFINSQETTASTGISDFLPQAVSNPVQSDLESSSSQDLRKGSREEEERSHLQFYFNSCEDGWYCKICSTFAPHVMIATLFVNTAGTFGDHPTRNANRNLQTQRCKDAISNKLVFDNLSKWRTNVSKLLQQAALSTEISVTATNCFVIKSFFSNYMVDDKEKLGSLTQFLSSQNFSIVQLFAACDREEIKKHLLHTPQNINYMSPEYISTYSYHLLSLLLFLFYILVDLSFAILFYKMF